MINKKTVFVLGAGASCPYGYPSGAGLRELICFDGGFLNSYLNFLRDSNFSHEESNKRRGEVHQFITIFKDSNIKSIDVFMANNPKLAPIGKYIISFEIFRAEINSRFGEEAKREQERLEDLSKSPDNKRYIWGTAGFHGGDWYFYLYSRLLEGLTGKNNLPDFSDNNPVFITFNYDRSLEYFFYNSLKNLFSEVEEEKIIKALKKLKILHVYGQIAPLKYQEKNNYVDYKPKVKESLLERAAKNIRTIYEEEQNPELIEAQNLLKQAEQIFCLGFGYAAENVEILKLPELIASRAYLYGTGFGLEPRELKKVKNMIIDKLPVDPMTGKNAPDVRISIEDMDCLRLLRNHL